MAVVLVLDYIGRLPPESTVSAVAAVWSRTTGNPLEASTSGHPL